ncbi:DnaJ domain-containing protein [Marivirga sp.]|uniref:J domain-containing protein n=1 Tax=Marivirga sp. TaxID=2018662 RepID=UPI0025F1A34E|nr:DnaJ domain-containing protein [Marivirga sp.]
MAKHKINYNESIEVLRLNPGASLEEIKDAYRRLAKQYHPDIYQLDNGEKFKEISSAYYFLKKHPHPPIQHQKEAHYGNSTNDYKDRRQAYYNRQKAKREQEAAQKEEMFDWLFVKLRLLVLVILIFNCLLIIDYIIPSMSEEVKIAKIKTVNAVSRYPSQRSEKSYKLELDNGISFKIAKQKTGIIDINEAVVLNRSRIFREVAFIKNKSGDHTIYNEYGLFRIFGFLIPVSIILIIAYQNFIKNNDYKLTIFLIFLIIFIFQLVLVF